MGRNTGFAGLAAMFTLGGTGCAGPGVGLGPGMGPVWDQFTGLLLFACACVGLYWLLRRSSLLDLRRGKLGPVPEPAGMEEAENILRQRYARGEIGREEYLEKLNDLRKRAA